MLTRTQTYRQIGGFNERDLPVAFHDIDLCLRLHQKSYRIVYTPFAELYHHESASRGGLHEQTTTDSRDLDYMRRVWATYISSDPYYNPNLTRSAEDFSPRLDEQPCLESFTQQLEGRSPRGPC